MIDLKSKQREIKSKFKIIQQANDTKKGVDDPLKKYDDTLENLQGQIGGTLSSYADKAKQKLPNVENIFEKITSDLQKILPVKQKDGESMLRRITRESVKETTEAVKPIFLDNVRKLFFASDSDMNCGTTTAMPVSGLTISPKEFDLLDMLQTDPQTGLGKIIYEGAQPNGDKIKMNKIFYEKFSGGVHIFQSIDETQLFSLEWDSAIQKYKIEGLQGAGTTIDQFITKYYESIEFPKISDVLKNSFSMLIPAGGINVTNSSYDVNMNKLTRVIDKICAVCAKSENTGLKQNAVDQFNEGDIDFGAFFNFDDVEGIDIDDENLRYQKVLRFTDCNNFTIPVNQGIVEEFAFFSTTKTDITDLYNSALSKVAKDAASKNLSIPYPQFAANLDFNALKNLPKALISSIFSAKMFFPIVVLWKIIKSGAINAISSIQTIIKNLTKMVYNIIKDIFNKFLTVFWTKVKPQLALILKDLAKKILKNSKKRYLVILTALIDILAALVPFIGIASCEDFYNAILQLLNLLKVGITQKIPGLLLQVSKMLPGYSEDRAIMNVGELLEANGIPTGDLYGQDNNVVAFFSSIIKGHQKEMDQNSFVQVSLDYAQIPVAPLGGVAIIPPGLLKAHGKLT